MSAAPSVSTTPQPIIEDIKVDTVPEPDAVIIPVQKDPEPSPAPTVRPSKSHQSILEILCLQLARTNTD